VWVLSGILVNAGGIVNDVICSLKMYGNVYIACTKNVQEYMDVCYV